MATEPAALDFDGEALEPLALGLPEAEAVELALPEAAAPPFAFWTKPSAEVALPSGFLPLSGLTEKTIPAWQWLPGEVWACGGRQRPKQEFGRPGTNAEEPKRFVGLIDGDDVLLRRDTIPRRAEARVKGAVERAGIGESRLCHGAD
jgi:hypothetical protein